MGGGASSDSGQRRTTPHTRNLTSPASLFERTTSSIPDWRQGTLTSACEVPSLRDLFSSLCDDMLGEILSEPDRPGPACVSGTRALARPVGARGGGGGGGGPGAAADRRPSSRSCITSSDSPVTIPYRALQIWAGPDESRHDFSSGSSLLCRDQGDNRKDGLVGGYPRLNATGATSREGLCTCESNVWSRSKPAGTVCPMQSSGILRVAGVPTPQLLRRVEEYGYAPADAEHLPERCASLNSSAALILLTKVFRDLSGCRSCQRTR